MKTLSDFILEEITPEQRRIAKASLIKIGAWKRVKDADYMTPLIAQLIRDLESGKIVFQGHKFPKD